MESNTEGSMSMKSSQKPKTLENSFPHLTGKPVLVDEPISSYLTSKERADYFSDLHLRFVKKIQGR